MFHETMSAKYLLLTGATGEEIPLTWLQRLKIAVQCAQGMYIHIYILIDLFVTVRVHSERASTERHRRHCCRQLKK